MALILNEPYRLRMITVGVMVGLGVSSTYAFSQFTEPMQQKYGFNQSDITTISTVANVLGYCAFIFGIIFDNFGPKVNLIISGITASLGLFLVGLTLDGKITGDSKNTMVVLFCVFYGIMYLGCPSLDGASIMPLMMNFPLDRGFMVIIQKTFSGLGTSILSQYYQAWFSAAAHNGKPKTSEFAYFLSAHVLLCASVGALFIEMPTYSPCDFVKRRITSDDLQERQATLQLYMSQRPPRQRIYTGVAIVLSLLVHLTTVSITGSYVKIAVGSYRATWAIAIALLASFSLMALPFKFLGAYRKPDRDTKYPAIGEVDVTTELVHVMKDISEDGVAPVNEAEEEAAAPAIMTDPQYRGTFWSHLLSVDLWLLWLCFFSMWGTGTVLIFNSAQIYRSKNWGEYGGSQQALYISLIGVGSAVGRITSGTIDMLVARRRAHGEKQVYTTLFLPISSILLGLAFFFLALMPAKALILPFFIGAMGNGMGWGLGALCVRIVYAEDIGKHYNFMWSSGIVSTIALNRFMFGNMMDNEARKRGTLPKCNAPSCVTKQMWILLACNVMSTCAAVALHWRFSRYSNKELARVKAEQEQLSEWQEEREDEKKWKEDLTKPDFEGGESQVELVIESTEKK